jgi:hypothetical protein
MLHMVAKGLMKQLLKEGVLAPDAAHTYVVKVSRVQAVSMKCLGNLLTALFSFNNAKQIVGIITKKVFSKDEAVLPSRLPRCA